ncbi:MAG: hypothetical protein DYG85_10830 [Chloroflexi bacterium CFX1]|nr:hypothetical protein [Chloroflexi bacterium CFX1]MCQ3952862.1 hypothetical protein [Chloroflexota bacterium]MDL1920091.1 hypothetical protein [Chloroflexi bacterium CFX5]NUQ59183.1 hypothetical protein [Anaerolineales bacterium]
MFRQRWKLALSALLFSTLACAALFGDETAGKGAGMVMPPTPTLAAVSCPLITEEIVRLNAGAAESSDEGFEAEGGEEEEAVYLATYPVSGDELGEPYFDSAPAELEDEQKDDAAHRRIWGYFTSLIPLEYRPTIAEYSIMTDGRENLLAAVAQTADDPNLWRLEVDIADTSDYYYLTFTLAHEFAHLFTLAPDQMPPSLAIFNNPEDNDIYLREVSACPTFFPGEGCSTPDSYINQFYERFWTDIYEEWNEINLIEDEDEYSGALDDFYYQYEDRFLTDYSATHPAEDIAEAFGFFIFTGQPDGDTVAEQKIRFFYEYPELTALRETMRRNVCLNFQP